MDRETNRVLAEVVGRLTEGKMDNNLAKRAVACKGFRWMAGMLIADHGAGIRFCWQEDGVLHGAANEGGAWMRVHADRALPDLDDPATRGCLLALVRRAWGCQHIVATPDLIDGVGDIEWCVTPTQGPSLYGFTEAEALVAALEACNA